MTEIPTSAQARTWQPQTEDDEVALALYDQATITGIAAVLPSFAPGMDRDVLAGLIRQWASQELHRRRDPARSFTIKKFEEVATQLQKAAEALAELPGEAKSLMAVLRSGGGSFDDWCRDLDFIRSAPDKIMELATLAGRAGRRRKSMVRRGRPQSIELRFAILDLCLIYRAMTGMPPVVSWDPIAVDEDPRGQFEAFVAVATKPLWPKAGWAGQSTRKALDMYRNIRQRR